MANRNEGYSHNGSKVYQASFAGYFPADEPKYSCIVVINHPLGDYYGASVAGPVFKQIADYVYAYDLGKNEDFKYPGKDIPEDYPGLAAGKKRARVSHRRRCWKCFGACRKTSSARPCMLWILILVVSIHIYRISWAWALRNAAA